LTAANPLSLGNVSSADTEVLRYQGRASDGQRKSLKINARSAGDDGIARAGGRLAASVVLSTAAFETLKFASGRARPDAGQGAWAFSPFSGNGSLPSGHSTVAFALATSLSHELHNPIVTVVLYTAAAGTAWSRLYDQRHWGSDVLFGAALGIASAQVAHGRWRIFGVRPPELILDAGRTGVQVTVPLATH
jgi:membrane-associated phospholipid phosphatase